MHAWQPQPAARPQEEYGAAERLHFSREMLSQPSELGYTLVRAGQSIGAATARACGWKVVTMNCAGLTAHRAPAQPSMRATVVRYCGSSAASISSKR